MFRRRSFVDVAIDLLPGAEEDAVIDHIARQIERVAALLPGLVANDLGPEVFDDVADPEIANEESGGAA